LRIEIKYWIFRFLLFVCLVVNGQEGKEARDVIAKINLFQSDIFVQIDAVVQNTAAIYEENLEYQLLLLKRQKGTVKYDKEERRGEFELLPNEKKTIASNKFNIKENEELKGYLFVRDGRDLIAKDSIVINEVIEILKTTAIEEEEIEIIGLVVENVRTKIGKDFYDFFYQKYNSSGNKYPFVININEKPFLGGRGALVSVEIGDDKIFEFQARPDEEMLQNAAAYSLKLIETYSKTRNTTEKVY
jgi:hypothetical protein